MLKGPDIYVKRDDQFGLTQGGNKTRKLEFLIADALAQGADSVITVGGVQSNHCRLTLSAANKEGLDCHLIVEEDLRPGPQDDAADGQGNPPSYNGNFFLFDVLGAASVDVHPNGADLLGLAEAKRQELVEAGKNPYVVAVGGSTVTGSLGYVVCANEIVEYVAETGIDFDAVVVASGSAGMQSGLVAGLEAAGSSIPVIGVNVSRPRSEQEEKVHSLVTELSTALGIPEVDRSRITALDDYVGGGYTLPTAEMVEAVRLFATTEGILLDPVYTGKTAAGLIDLVRRGTFDSDSKILFIHSGGVPGLYARTGSFLDGEEPATVKGALQ